MAGRKVPKYFLSDEKGLKSERGVFTQTSGAPLHFRVTVSRFFSLNFSACDISLVQKRLHDTARSTGAPLGSIHTGIVVDTRRAR
jgi:hypothetical protein